MQKKVRFAFLGLPGVLALVMVVGCHTPDKDRRPQDSLMYGLTGVQNGDIIFQTSTSSQSHAIQLATHSPYSHVGIIYETSGQLFVYEAVQPVKLTKLSDWIKRGDKGHYVVKRLKNSQQLLTSQNLAKMKAYGEKFMGKDYDIYFEWSDDKIYCSELVWKIYREALGIEVGDLQQLRDFDLTSNVVKNQLSERYGHSIPLDEKVISPAALFHSDQLVIVAENTWQPAQTPLR